MIVNEGKTEELRQNVIRRLYNLDLAELTMVADYIRGMEAANNFLNRT